MVLSGSLFIGDSVKGTLKRLALNRRGTVKVALFNELNWFRANRAKVLNEMGQGKHAAIIAMAAQAENPTKSSISISLYGVDDDFFALGPVAKNKVVLEDGKIYLNESAAKELNCKKGETINVSFFKATFLPLDAPLTNTRDSRVTTRFEVGGILSAKDFGDFDYRTIQTIGPKGFVPRQHLATKLERAGFANCLLTNDERELFQRISKSFELVDLGLQLRKGFLTELMSKSIFISPFLVKAARATGLQREEIYTYFVNEIRKGDRSVPYSFVAGTSGGPLSAGLADDELKVNEWLAQRLKCQRGDELTLKAFRLNPLGRLYEESAKFKVHSIIPITGAAADKNLMPPFPGMKNAQSCDDWEPGIPIDLDKVKDDDEKYWEKYKGTPKAFCKLTRAQHLWSTRFGSMTAIRFPNNSVNEVTEAIRKNLDLSQMGFKVRNLLEESTVGVNKAVDFSGLFIGLSFFVIIAALILCNLLLGFYLDERQSEIGLFRVLHFTEGWLSHQLLAEGLLCFFLGGLPGITLGIAYAYLILTLLSTLWQGAVNTQQIGLIVNLPTVFISLAITLAIVALTFYWKLRKYAHFAMASQLQGRDKFSIPSRSGYFKTGTLFLLFSIVVVTLFPLKGEVAKIAAFFIGGFLLLIASTQLCLWALLCFSDESDDFSMKSLALKNSLRRMDRSKAVIRLIACAIFLILAVTVNRKGLLKDPFDMKAGTGGFTFFVETTLPMTGDLNSDFGRKELKLRNLSSKVHILPLPSSSGNEASCLNLNRVIRPRLLGVDPKAFQGRFNIKEKLEEVAEGWQCLLHEFAEPRVIPVVADSEVIMWALGKGLGQDLEYENSRGQKYKLRFVGGLSGSIFQGNVLVSMDNFYKLCPESSGYRTLLVDSPKAELEMTKATLVTALSRLGGQVQTCAKRLAKFNGVQNTYLSIFLALGGLSMILGCVGLAILLRRNIIEREDEFFIMRTLKFSKAQLRFIVFYEHIMLFGGGACCGLLSAALALVPATSSATGLIPWKEMLLFLSIILITGIVTLYSSLSFANLDGKLKLVD